MLAGRSVGPSAGAEFDLALVEVLLELIPLGRGDRTVFLGRAYGAASGEVHCVVLHHILVEHRLWYRLVVWMLACRMMAWTSGSVSFSLAAIRQAAVCRQSCQLQLAPSRSLARCRIRLSAQ